MTWALSLEIARWIVGGALAAFGAFIVAFNWATIPWNAKLVARGEKRHVSPAPIGGPLLLTAGVFLALWRPTLHVVWFWLADWPTVSLPVALALSKRRA